MSVFDKFAPRAKEVSKQAGEMAQNAAKKSKKIAATARVNLSIATENDKIKKAQIELGKLYYKDFVAGTEPELAEYLPWCDKISASLKTIEALNESLLAMDEEEIAPEEAPVEAAAVAEEAPEEAPVAEEAAEEAPVEAPAEEAPAAPVEEEIPQPPIANLYVDATEVD